MIRSVLYLLAPRALRRRRRRRRGLATVADIRPLRLRSLVRLARLVPFARVLSVRVVLALLPGLAALSAGCRDEAASPASAPVAAPGRATDRSAEAMEDALRQMLGAYETIRKQLAHDTLDGVSEAAGRMATAGAVALVGATGAVRTAVQQVVAQAAAIQRLSTLDLVSMRERFGPLSQAVIVLLDVDPRLRQGRTVFECPATQGARRWVQTGSKPENPYLPTMSHCGGEIPWADDAAPEK